ncbi:MAG: hypothetical protein ABJA90_05820 [Ginsengibacter sp.]
MKNIILLILLNLTGILFLQGQGNSPDLHQRKAITFLIDQYSEAREKSDTILLKNIITNDMDQLVSTGEWRIGMSAAVEGMIKSSATSPGKRTLHVEKIRMFNPNSAIVDCKYEIQNKDGSSRKMWSTFLVAASKSTWKISAIRNMLPASQ